MGIAPRPETLSVYRVVCKQGRKQVWLTCMGMAGVYGWVRGPEGCSEERGKIYLSKATEGSEGPIDD